MHIRLVVWAIALIGLLLSGTRSSLAEPRIALVIGNGTYSGIPALRNPVNDARAMDQALRGLGFEVIRLENASKDQIERGLTQLTQRLPPNAVSLMYYAGHGVQMGGHNYLIPTDALITSEGALRNQSIDVDAVISQVAGARARLSIVILDACRDNPFRLSEQIPAGASATGPRLVMGSNNSRFRSVSGGLASVAAPAGVLIAYATAPGSVAADGGGVNGLYTAELIHAMSMPGASIERVFKQTRLEVLQKSGGMQIPWEASSLTGEFSFRPGAVQSVPAAPSPSEMTTGSVNAKCFSFNGKQFCE
jgi:uncharacterized caspase-like protein